MKREEWKEIHEYCMGRACAYESRPFGEYPICYRVAGKIFAQLIPKDDWFKITLKTNPDAADFYRRAYPGVVVRGYHCPPVQQPYWNTIDLAQFEKENLLHMIDEAYEEVVRQLPGKERRRLPAISGFCFEKKDEFVVCQGETTIAWGAYKVHDQESVIVKKIYVELPYRGRGIGRELLRRMEADARIAGYRYGILEEDTLSEAAGNLFKKQGYKTSANPVADFVVTDTVFMQKKL